jgi:hypothetical protein
MNIYGQVKMRGGVGDCVKERVDCPDPHTDPTGRSRKRGILTNFLTELLVYSMRILSYY